MREIWREIEEAPLYFISNFGRVWSTISDSILIPTLDGGGYPMVTLIVDRRRLYRKIHTLVLNTFSDYNHEGLEANHDNGNKLDNHENNLEWVTSSENNLHAYRIGLKKPSGGRKKIPVRIIETGEIFDSEMACARAINGYQSHIDLCLRGLQKQHRGYTFEYVE